MTLDISETCTCGTQLTVRGVFHGQPVTHCSHCDVPLIHQPDTHPRGTYNDACGPCYRYEHHVLRIFPK